MDRRKRGSTSEFFRECYSPERSRIARKIERLAFGHDVGLQGYTTLAQAETLREHLRLSAGDRLLDIGAGRGWPGVHIGRTRDCQVLSTDIPLDALLEAKVRTTDAALPGASSVLAADGRALPFPGQSVDKIVHTDVFC